MPYTFLHPSFILLFAKRFSKYVSIPALIIGSFVPDLDIIYRFTETRQHIFSYTPENIVFVLIPIGIVLTYYMQLVLIPISGQGIILPMSNSLKQNLLLLPKIIFSLLIAILLHLYLDDFAHFDDAKGLSLRIGADLGYDPEETGTLYAILLYFPQLIISGVGLILTLICFYIFRKEWSQHTQFLRKNKYATLLLSAFIFVTFTSMKIIKAGVEKGMEIDSVLIGITTGLMSAFLLAPVGLYIFMQLKTKRSALLPLVFIFSIYMLGLGHKEYLAIYIVKGVFITFVSFTAFSLMDYKQIDYKVLLALFLNFILVFVHPFTHYFTFLILFECLLLAIFIFSKNKLSILFHSVLKSLIVGSLLNLAYYASNKGLGLGMLVIFLIAFSYEFSHYKNFPLKARTLLIYLAIFLSCLIIFSVKAELGILSILLIVIMTIYSSFSQRLSLPNIHFMFFVIIVPLLATIYLYFEFSRLYGIFSVSQVLLILLLAYSDQIKDVAKSPDGN